MITIVGSRSTDMPHVRMLNVWKIISTILANMTTLNVGRLKLGCQHVNGMTGTVGSMIAGCSGFVTRRKVTNVYPKSIKNLVSKMMKTAGEKFWHFLTKIVKKMWNVSKSFTICQTVKMMILIAGRNCIGVQTAKRVTWTAWRNPCTFLTVPSKRTRYSATRSGYHIRIANWTTESAGKTGMILKIPFLEECSGILLTVMSLQHPAIVLWALGKWWIIKEGPWRKHIRSIESFIWKEQDWWPDNFKLMNTFCIWIICFLFKLNIIQSYKCIIPTEHNFDK